MNRRTMIKLGGLVTTLAAAAACVHGSTQGKSEGPDLSAGKVDQVVVGKTKEADLAAMFGNPDGKSLQRVSDDPSLVTCGAPDAFVTVLVYSSVKAGISGASSATWQFALDKDATVCAKKGDMK